MFCDVLAVQERLTLSCGGGVPVAVKFSTVGEFEALLANDTLPDAVPVPEGVNVTVNCACCPAGIVTGTTIRLRQKLSRSRYRRTQSNHSLTSCAESRFVGHSFPRSRCRRPGLWETRTTVPGGMGVPVPLSGVDRFGFDPFETIATFPEKFPVEGGAKATVNV
jgi:hypothetical protein